MRQRMMVGFLQAQNCTNLVSALPHPDSRQDFASADDGQTIGRMLQEGEFHVGCFDDRPVIPDRFSNDHRQNDTGATLRENLGLPISKARLS